MNIRKRLILGQIAVFIIPFLMIGVIVASVFLGLLEYARSGNHLAVESASQFEVMANSLSHVVFHGIRHDDKLNTRFRWTVDLLNPVQNYVIVRTEKDVMYTYGNENLSAMLQNIPGIEQISDFTAERNGRYIHVSQGDFYFLEKATVSGTPYYLIYVSQRAPYGTDGSIETAYHTSMWVVLGLLLAIILGTIWLFSRFILSYIMKPLEKLEKRADEISEGKLDGYISYTNDDEMKPVIDSFNLMSRKLKESLTKRAKEEEQKKELIASLSHDIRTPLTAIEAAVSGLEDNVADTPEKRKRYLSIIRRRSDELNKRLEQLILFTGMELFEETPPDDRVSVEDTVRETMERYGSGWKEQGAEIEISLEQDLEIKGNEVLLRRILTNLINNSIKYKMGDKAHIKLEAHDGHGEVTFVIADDGPGVKEEELSRITDLFYRTDKARTKTSRGSGLGLAIVDRAVKLMDGTMKISLVKPHGLCFTIVFPKAED